MKLKYLRKRLIKPYYKWVYVIIKKGNKKIKVRKRVKIKANWKIVTIKKNDRRKNKTRKAE
jgi:hypothetical protein